MFSKLKVGNVASRIRSASLIASVAAVAAVGTTSAQADFPDKPITIIVPYNPGGGTDTTGRFLANEAEKYFSVPVTVKNRSGASGTVGTAEAAASKRMATHYISAPPTLWSRRHIP